MTQSLDTAPAGSLLDHFLCFSIYSSGLAFNRIYKPLLDPYGITYPQFIALIALNEHDQQTVSQLGDKLHLESNTLTPLIKRLEAAGLVTRTRDTRDERVVRLSLTQAGRELAHSALGCVPGEVFKLTGMDHATLAALNTQLADLATALRQAAA